MLMHLKHV